MEKVNKKKEIRVIFNLENEKDKKLYEQILNISSTQPGRVIKRILVENFDNEISNQNEDNVNIKLLEVLGKLSDKIDNLTISQDVPSQNISNNKNKESQINQVFLTGEISSDDINDIEF